MSSGEPRHMGQGIDEDRGHLRSAQIATGQHEGPDAARDREVTHGEEDG